MLQQDRRNILVGETSIQECTNEEDVRVGATRHSDALALQIRNLRDLGIFAGHQRGPFGARIDVNRLDRIAVDLRDQRGRACGRSEVDRASIEKLKRLVRTRRLHPDDLDSVLLEFLFEQSLFFQDDGDRVVSRPIDSNLLGRIGRKCTGRQHRA